MPSLAGFVFGTLNSDGKIMRFCQDDIFSQNGGGLLLPDKIFNSGQVEAFVGALKGSLSTGVRTVDSKLDELVFTPLSASGATFAANSLAPTWNAFLETFPHDFFSVRFSLNVDGVAQAVVTLTANVSKLPMPTSDPEVVQMISSFSTLVDQFALPEGIQPGFGEAQEFSAELPFGLFSTATLIVNPGASADFSTLEAAKQIDYSATLTATWAIKNETLPVFFHVDILLRQPSGWTRLVAQRANIQNPSQDASYSWSSGGQIVGDLPAPAWSAFINPFLQSIGSLAITPILYPPSPLMLEPLLLTPSGHNSSALFSILTQQLLSNMPPGSSQDGARHLEQQLQIAFPSVSVRANVLSVSSLELDLEFGMLSKVHFHDPITTLQIDTTHLRFDLLRTVRLLLTLNVGQITPPVFTLKGAVEISGFSLPLSNCMLAAVVITINFFVFSVLNAVSSPQASSSALTVSFNLPQASSVSLKIEATSSVNTAVVASYEKQLGSFVASPEFSVTGNERVCADPFHVI